MKDFLIVSAFEPEADLLLAEGLPVLISGIGFLRSALSLQQYLISKGEMVREIIFIGSAGVYLFGRIKPCNIDENRFTHSNEFLNIEIGVMEGRSGTPDIIKEVCRTQAGPLALRLSERLQSENSVTNTVQSITLDDVHFTEDMNHTVILPDVENMETYGLAHVALKFNKKFTAFYAVTNNVCRQGSLQWRESHRRLSVMLQSELISLAE